MSQQMRAAGDELAALAHLIAAQALEPGGSRPPLELLSVATGYFTMGDHEAALHWYALVLALDPAVAVAHQNLAAIHAARGDEAEAEACRKRAYGIQRVFIEPVPQAQRRLLILCVGHTAGNIPYEALLSRSASSRIKYVIDFAEAAEDALLPAFDGVFNAIGEPDVALQLADRLAQFVARHAAQPLLNPPAAVERTQRQHLPALLGCIDGVLTASCVRVDALAAADGIELPALVRPIASHGGVGLRRCDSAAELQAAIMPIGGPCYLTAFIDYRSADGFFRKYRVVFIDGEPYPYHLAISPDWMVHYFSADMPDHSWKLAEDRRFTEDPAAALGKTAMASIREIGRRIGLDYAGIDFTLMPDGRVFVFEANATMLVHGERADGSLAFRNAAVQRIAEAFERMLVRRVDRR